MNTEKNECPYKDNNFEVFLCHNSIDKPEVKSIAKHLIERGISPWLDEYESRPGFPWQVLLEEQIAGIKSAAVFVGSNGVGPWQDLELKAFLSQFIKRGCPVIPVILPSCKNVPKLPIFLELMTWVDFRKTDPDPMEQLVWGITGERSQHILSNGKKETIYDCRAYQGEKEKHEQTWMELINCFENRPRRYAGKEVNAKVIFIAKPTKADGDDIRCFNLEHGDTIKTSGEFVALNKKLETFMLLVRSQIGLRESNLIRSIH